MATPFSTIIDRALITIRDYKLDVLYEDDSDAFENILLGYVTKAIPYFSQCLKPLTYNDDTLEFDADLDMYEINILADYVVIVWYEAELQDVLEFKEALQDKEFKRYSTGQNLTPRQNYLTELKTRVHQEGQNYQALQNFSNLPFFGGGA
jgi:hypothetical protein